MLKFKSSYITVKKKSADQAIRMLQSLKYEAIFLLPLIDFTSGIAKEFMELE